jgi:hypothetical protein
MGSADLDQSKRGLQDDHDPNDLGQKQANKKRGVEPEKKEKTDDMGFPPDDESKFG